MKANSQWAHAITILEMLKSNLEVCPNYKFHLKLDLTKACRELEQKVTEGLDPSLYDFLESVKYTSFLNIAPEVSVVTLNNLIEYARNQLNSKVGV